MARNDDNNTMSREEAGRMGGEATARTHDKEFYQEIGEKGGEARGGSNNRSQSDDRNGMSREEAGRKGGRS
ncbi:KGG domain-containing protein [Cohnella hashimotonis]|uniref:KGG domain-containing protein n=1 Tax=Cohnella hashimotonis TaxID=2826895 RepID=A0ABT6TIW6_9BACL|nr:KGG domain-containing protein [Cohnella hashimotonis]MDI4646501.1 KGG domain-containing protein [Cohnella hashimotonis]